MAVAAEPAERVPGAGVGQGMAKVNANDRASLEAAYSPEAFANDTARNEGSTGALVHGVRIASAPDADGWFALEPATRHAGEPETAYFLAPVRRREELIDQGRAPSLEAPPRPAAGYSRFLDDIVATARRFGYRAADSPGQGDPRIQGLRQ